MDRIDAMRVFVTALDENSLAGAGRKLGRSAAAVSRAVAFLEQHVGAPLLYRTTRNIKLSEAGETYAEVCRRALLDLEAAERAAVGDQAAPRGVLTLTAPVLAGEDILRPILDAFMEAVPTVGVRLYLLDRPINLIEEGIDVALRVAHLRDGNLTAWKLGEVRRIIAAAPRYLASHPKLDEPSDLARHQIIAMTHFGLDSWSFPPLPGSAIPRTVQFQPRMVINSVRGAVASAVGGHGVTRLFSYHIAPQLAEGSLRRVLEKDEHPPLPVNFVAPQGRADAPKLRAFLDFAIPRLQAHYTAANATLG